MGTYLSLKWTTSKARDTYGYNVVTLTDMGTSKRYRAMGGGYDMVGTVLGQWLSDNFVGGLKGWAEPLGVEDEDRAVKHVKGFYGAIIMPTGRVRVDGACGLDCVLRIARAMGLNIERTYVQTGRNRGETTGWLVD